MDNLEPGEPMNLLNLIAKSSVHVIVFDKATNEPVQFGSGCVVFYRGKLFVLSVNHVTRINGVDTYTLIETGLPPKDGQTPYYSTGGLIYFDVFKAEGLETGDLEQITLEESEPLDVTFTTVGDDILLMQKEFEYQGIEITEGQKVVLNLDEATVPDKEEYYGFFGHIKQEVFGEQIIKSEVTFKLDLEYKQKTTDGFYMFHAPELIEKKEDYSGTSGSPILNSKGQLVGLTCSISLNSKMIFAFPIDYCRNLIDAAIESGLID